MDQGIHLGTIIGRMVCFSFHSTILNDSTIELEEHQDVEREKKRQSICKIECVQRTHNWVNCLERVSYSVAIIQRHGWLHLNAC